MWNTFKPEDGLWYRWRLCGAEVYLRKIVNEWQSAFKTIPFYELSGISIAPDNEAPPANLSIASTWGVDGRVSLRPYLPMPYFTTLREKTRILPGVTVPFIVDMPPLLKIECSPNIALAEAMPYEVSKTWFGDDTTTGNLYYSLPGAVHLAVSDTVGVATVSDTADYPAALVRCAITLRNTSKLPFDLRYLLIYPKSLSIYVHGWHLVTDSLEFEYTGTDLKMNVRKQQTADCALLTAGSKADPGEEFMRWSVDIIKNLTRLS
jgi:hypothetical protein